MSGARRLALGAASVLGARTLGMLFGVLTTLLLAAALGPASLGNYYLLTLVPGTMLALLSFGLPAAFTYHAGRGNDIHELRTLALGLAVGLSSLVTVGLLALQPVLTSTVLASAPPSAVILVAFAVPGVFVTAFSQAVLLGRSELRSYTLLQIGQAVAIFVGQLLAVAGGRAGLFAALLVYGGVIYGVAVASSVAMLRIAPWRPTVGMRTTRSLVRYGLALQPASLAGFFSYRADVYLLSYLLRDPAVLGVYGLAVNVAELCFHIPDAISTALFPRVASIDRAQASAIVPRVSRISLLATGSVAIVLAVVTAVGVPLVLPAYAASVAPTLILLPGVVALGISKVLSGYLTGIGRPGPVSGVATATLIINLLVNLALIPSMGAEGAAAASLVSYGCNAALVVTIAARLAGLPISTMVVPRREDLTALRGILPGRRWPGSGR